MVHDRRTMSRHPLSRRQACAMTGEVVASMGDKGW